MLLHLGEDEMVFLKDVIAIISLENGPISKDTQEFLKTAKEEGFIKKISQEDPKTFVITEENNKCVIYHSPISSHTLLKRVEIINKFKNNRVI